MSIIESTPQMQKEYDGRKQDHGDAASRKGRFKDMYEAEFDRRADKKRLEEHLRQSLSEAESVYEHMTATELETATNSMLGEYADDFADHFDFEYSEESADEEVESAIDINQDGFLTEADLGLRSKHEIAKLMAQRGTLDPDFYRYYDMVYSYFNSHIRIRKRL